MEFVVEAEAVVRRFGAITAVDGLDVRIKEGETYGLLGPNGSGKTTLIRMVVGLLAPSKGSLRVMGEAMPSVKVLGRIGYMPQSPALYPDLTVEENLGFFAGVYGIRSSQRIQDVLSLVELTDRASAQVFTLSGGMRQRLSLACTLLHEPALLVLDEPTVGIDPQLRVSFWDYFHQLNRDGVTIIVSSHVMDEAERCDRLGLMRQGKIIAEGSAEELKMRAGKYTLEEAFLAFAGGGG